MPGTKEHSGGARKGAGRKVGRAMIRAGQGVSITHVYPDGTANLGRGRAVIEGIGNDRIVKLPQDDGSEIRILIVV